jgi:hypothetical protein
VGRGLRGRADDAERRAGEREEVQVVGFGERT